MQRWRPNVISEGEAVALFILEAEGAYACKGHLSPGSMHGWPLAPSACAAGRRHWPRAAVAQGCATLASSAGGRRPGNRGAGRPGRLASWCCWLICSALIGGSKEEERAGKNGGESSSERRRAALACSWKKEKDQKNGKAAGGGRL